MTTNLCNGVYRVAGFDTDALGSSIAVGEYVDGEGLYAGWGLTINAIAVGVVGGGPNAGQPKRLMTFPSESATYTGADTDLINVGSGLGNILIISDNNQGPAQGDSENTMEDTPDSGIMSFVWDRRVEILEFTIIDPDISPANLVQGYADIAGTIPVGLNVITQGVDGSIEVIAVQNTPFIQRLDLTVQVGEGIGIDNIAWRECICPPGEFRDCAAECGATPTNTVDCAGVCYPIGDIPPNICDCAGGCYPTGTTPLVVPDCNGVCGGGSVPDCLGNCDGDAVLDCNDICDGDSFLDCGGNCTICTQPVTSCYCFD